MKRETEDYICDSPNSVEETPAIWPCVAAVSRIGSADEMNAWKTISATHEHVQPANNPADKSAMFGGYLK
jgi:hypothetical protein